MSKSSDENDDVMEPAAKRRRLVEFEPVRICSVSGVQDIDNRVLKVQHFKLMERFKLKERMIKNLEARIEGMEQRQTQDDVVMSVINRYWNRLDEDVRLLLQRFDAEAVLDDEDTKVSKEGTHFLAILSNVHSDEMEEKLAQRVEFSRRALAKLVQVYDRVVQRNELFQTVVSGEASAASRRSKSPKAEPLEALDETDGTLAPSVQAKLEVTDESLRKEISGVAKENGRLQKLVTKLQADNNRLNIQYAKKDDHVTMMETRLERKNGEVEDLRYELQKTMRREEKLEFRLAEYIRKEQTASIVVAVPDKDKQAATTSSSDDRANVSNAKLEELQDDLEVQKELAENRLAEIKEMTERNKNLAAELETATMRLKNLPSDVIVTSTEYLKLQSEFSCLYEDLKRIKQCYDEPKSRLAAVEAAYQQQLECIHNEESLAQERMKETLMELSNQLNQVRGEYEALCVEFENSKAANEQAGPIGEQATAMANTLATQNAQLKLEATRFKRKWKDALSMMAKSQKELEQERKNKENCILIKLDDPSEIKSPDPCPGDGGDILLSPPTEGHISKDVAAASTDSTGENIEALKAEIVELKSQLEAMKDLDSDKRERVLLIAAERRLQMEKEKLEAEIRTMTKMDRKEKVKLYNEDAKRKIRHLEEQLEKARKELANAKQEEEGLMNEMESTGQALEETIEKNKKLLQQIREKDEQNFQLMSDGIRASHAHKKLKEEKELLETKTTCLQNELAAKSFLCAKLEEKEKLMLELKATLESELRTREQANDSYRRKTAEATQTANDLRLNIEKVTTQLNEAQQSLSSNAAKMEELRAKISRLNEEKSTVKRSLERTKRMQKFENIDQLLEEENRMLRDTLQCPSCKVRQKNAILTKCFHVFCFECLKTRYENRRRKCPKCNAAFGANDYHRLFLE